MDIVVLGAICITTISTCTYFYVWYNLKRIKDKDFENYLED